MNSITQQPTTTPDKANATELILGFVSTMIEEKPENAEKAKQYVNRMVEFSFDYLDPQKRADAHKKEVAKLMALAIQFRHATAQDYDSAYKKLEQELYSYLSSIK